MVGDEEEEDAIESMLLPDLSETEPYLSYEELQGLDAPVYSGKVSKDRYLEPEYLLPELAGQAPASELSGLQLNEELEKGVLTGGAAKINRINEDFLAKQNNDDFFEYERNKKSSALMKVNGNMNNNRPDAKLFMDIALVRPKNVPSCKDYQFVSSEKVKELNEKYNLHGNKKINSWYDGFEFSKDSPTAQRINSSEEFKNQILSNKNYDSKNKVFKSDKLEIEFKDDKNLQYSFGHMTILNPKITKDGYVEGLGYDMYNFEGKGLDEYKNEYGGITLNNSAYALQVTGDLQKYFILVPIKVKI